MLRVILVHYVSILCLSVYLDIHILIKMALLKGPVRMHMVIENKMHPKVTRTEREILYFCICLLQSGTCGRDKR